jgi:hypothetical protein
MIQRKRHARAAALLALLGTSLSACRDAQQHAAAHAPEYCRYRREAGAICDMFDPAAIPYPVALGLRPLSAMDAPDRALLIAHVATMTPRPDTVRLLAPIGPVPEGRRAYDRALPQPFQTTEGNARLLLLALTQPGAPGRIDIHSVILFETRVVASERVARGLHEASLRGAAMSGVLRDGFSLTDRDGSLGDLYRVRSRPPGPGVTAEQYVAGWSWTKIGADTPERRLDWYRSIVNDGSCSRSNAAPPLLLAPRPQAWLDEYEATCPIRPPASLLRTEGLRAG